MVNNKSKQGQFVRNGSGIFSHPINGHVYKRHAFLLCAYRGRGGVPYEPMGISIVRETLQVGDVKDNSTLTICIHIYIGHYNLKTFIFK